MTIPTPAVTYSSDDKTQNGDVVQLHIFPDTHPPLSAHADLAGPSFSDTEEESLAEERDSDHKTDEDTHSECTISVDLSGLSEDLVEMEVDDLNFMAQDIDFDTLDDDLWDVEFYDFDKEKAIYDFVPRNDIPYHAGLGYDHMKDKVWVQQFDIIELRKMNEDAYYTGQGKLCDQHLAMVKLRQMWMNIGPKN